jgi:hypothetical protein
MAEILTPGVINAGKLIELLKKYKINFPNNALTNYTKRYGIERPSKVKVSYKDKNYKKIVEINNPKRYYVEPTSTELKNIKKEYDINRLKASGTTEEGAKAFKVREKKATQLLREGYSQTQANEILKKEFPQFKGFKSTLVEAAKNLKKEGIEIKSGRGSEGTQALKVRDDLSKLNKSEVKDLIRSGETDINKLVTKTKKVLNTTPELAARRIGQLVEAFAGSDQYINAKSELLTEKSKPLIEGLGEVSKSRLYGGIGGGLQRQLASRNVSTSIGKSANFFNSLKKRIQESFPGSNFETDEIKNIMSSSRNKTGPYSIFLQGLRPDINQDKVYELDRQMGQYEKRIQQTDNIIEKKKLAKEFNTIAKEFTADTNKNLKSGQLPVRALEFSFEEPSKVIKNKNALENYGELFDDIYKKHGYSFKIPTDVKTVDEIRPFLQSQKGNTQVLKALAQKAPRVFGIPAAAYLGYQALSPSTAEAKVPSSIQDTETAMQDQVAEGQAPEPKLAEQIKYDSYAGFVKQDDPNVKASQSDVLYWIADNEIPEEVAEVGKMVGEVGAVLGGATVGLGLPDVKKTIEERRAIGKSPITGTLAKGFYRLGSPFATAAFTAPQILDEETTTKDIVTDPLNYLGLATMETLGKRGGTIAAPAAARAPGILGFAKDFGSLKNVGEAVPGKLSTALRLGLSPKVIAGASRFLGIPGLIASSAYSLYDYLSNKESE